MSARHVARPYALTLVTFGLVSLVIAQRGWGRLLHADWWGEDGAFFLVEALEQGAGSLLLPRAGSYFTVERLILLGSLQVVPLAWVPFVVCAVCMAVFAFVVSRIASDDYTWMIPSSAARMGTAVVFCLLPGLAEMLGNLCNLNWILFAWLALVGLKDPARPLAWRDQATACAVSLSVGTAILLVPLFLWRLVHASRHRFSGRRWVPEALALSIVIVVGIGIPLFAGGARPSASDIDSPVQVMRIWYDHAARLGAFTPWLGDRVTIAMSQYSPTGLYRAGKLCLLVFVLVWTWRRRFDPAAQAVLALAGGVSLWTVLAVLSRPYALGAFYDVGPWLYMSRYSFIMSFAGVLFWLVVLQPIRGGRRLASSTLFVFLTLTLVLALHRFTIPAYGSEFRWQAAVPVLERAGRKDCSQVVDVRQYPDPWAFSVRVGRSSRPCGAAEQGP